jgi:hypothetical protein
MSHLEDVIAPLLPGKIVECFQRGDPCITGHLCPNRDGKIAETFGMDDIILDQGRYMLLLELANKNPNDSFEELTRNPKLKNRFSALPPKELGLLLVEAQDERAYKNLEKSSEHIKKKNALTGRVLACNHERWGLFRKLSFTVRATYHLSVAFFVGYGATFLRWGRFIAEKKKEEILLHGMGERLSPLFLEYYGFGYNLERYPLTIEARLWNWILPR